jgi:hypothetical protein
MQQIHNRKVTMDFTTPLARLPEELAGIGGSLAPDGRRATVLVDRSNGSLQKLLGVLGRSGLPLADLEVAGAGLEDVFLELTAEAPPTRVGASPAREPR